jgi:hypothetical protein
MRLADLQRHPGWLDFVSIAHEQMGENSDWILNTISSHPEKLTGRTAIAKANRLKGVKQLLEAVDDEIKFGSSTPEAKAGQE